MPTRRRKMMLLLSTSNEDLKAIIIILHNLWKKRSKMVHKGGSKSPSYLCNSLVCQTSHLGLQESLGKRKKPNMLPLFGFKPYKAKVSSDILSGVSSSPGLLEAALKLF